MHLPAACRKWHKVSHRPYHGWHSGLDRRGKRPVGLVFRPLGNPPPQQLYNYFCYDGTPAAGEASTQDGSVQHYGGFADTGGGLKIGSPVALDEQLEQQCRLHAFDVKPQGLRATTERRHGGPADDLMRPQDHHDVDQHMEDEPATAVAAPCHLELGFSSF